MARKKIQDEAFSHEQFSAVAGDLERKNNRALVDELYGKNWAKETIDEFERKNGLAPAPKAEEVTYEHKLLDLSYASDGNLFNRLMNGTDYRILYMKDTFTPDGAYKMLVIYSKPKVIEQKEDKEKQ